MALALIVLDISNAFGIAWRGAIDLMVGIAFAAVGAALLHALRRTQAANDASLAAGRDLVADLMDSVPDGLALWAADGTLTAYNAAFLRHRSLPEKVGRGLNYRDFVANYVAKAGLAGDEAKAYVDRRLAAFAAVDGQPQELEKLDGSIEEVRFYRARDGGVVTTYRNVTLRKRAEIELARERERSADILAAISDGIVLWDSADRLAEVNAAAARMPLIGGIAEIGIDFAEFARRSLEKDPVDEAEGSDLPTFDERMANHANPTGAPQEFRYRDGTWMEVRKFRARDGGVVAVYRDVTQRKQAEADLALERGRLADIMDAIPDGIVLWDGDERLVAANAAASRFRANDPALEPGVRYPDYMRKLVAHGEIPSIVGGADAYFEARLAEHRAPSGVPLEFPRADGTWEEIRKFRARDGGVVTLYRDITGRKRSDEALALERGRLKDIMDAIPDGIALWDKNRRLVAFNRAAGGPRATNARLEIGMSYDERLNAMVALGHAKGDVEGFLAVRLAEMADPSGTPRERVRPDGQVDEIRKFPTLEGGVVFVSRDITERKRAMAELERQRKLLQEIMDALPDGLQIWGPDGRLVAFNRKAAEQRVAEVPLEIGVAYGDFIRRLAYAGAIEGIAGAEEAHIAARLADHADPATRHVEVRRTGGRWEEVRKVATSDGGWLSLLRDITQAKAAQSELRAQRDELERRIEERERLMAERDTAEAASRAKTEFLAMMSHELRTPMNGVIATTGLLARTRLADEQRLYLDTVQRSAQSLLTIIDDVLDWAKLEEGRIEIEAVDCAPAQIADNVVSLLRPAADQKGIELALDLDPALPEFGRIDPARLRQILLNLVSNAVKFTAEGRVRVRIKAEPRAGDGEGFMLSLEVEDSGIGIAPESVPKLFDRFTQADGSISRRFGGTGLGLAIVKRLLDLMGGSIEVSSRPGEGSRFVVRLPMAPGKRPAHVAAPLLPAPARALKLLVAEDNAINRMVVEHLLRELGHAADFAHDGAEAVTKARTGDYDAILMDVQMPDTDGIRATKLIRALDGARGRVPIVALTANAMAGDRERYLEAGMDDYVSKPIDAYELAAALARVAGGPAPATGAARKRTEPLSHAAGRTALAGLVDALKRSTENSG
ncbi:MAG: PAS-domain containing protein [Tagaea sp.]